MKTEFISIQTANKNAAILNWKTQNGYTPALKHRIKPTQKQVAIALVIINTPLPTASPITNPLLYKLVMKISIPKLKAKLRLAFL